MREKKDKRKQNKEPLISYKGIDLTIVFVSLFLSVFCLVFVYSASAFELNDKVTLLKIIHVTSSERLLFMTLFYIFAGIIMMLVVASFNFRRLEDFIPNIYGYVIKNPTIYYLVSCSFFIYIEVMKHVGGNSGGDGAEAVNVGLGTIRKANGAYRWINVIPNSRISYQPSEVVKLLLIIAFAIMLYNAGMMLQKLRGIALYLAIAGIPSMLVLLCSSDLSSSIVIFAVLFIMMIVAGHDYRKTGLTILVIGLLGFLVMLALIIPNKGKPESEIHPYQAKRILAWIYPDDYPATSDQTTQAMYAIGSGGLFGEGIGNSMQKIKKLPEAQNDMIFALICEELGLFGGLLVLSLYFVMLLRMFMIACETNDMFDRMVVVGVMAHIGLQVLINVCVVTRIFPNTGLPLPLISAGGSSIVFMYIELGFVLNAGKRIERR